MTVSATYSEVSRNPRTETRILLLLIWAVAALTLVVTFGTGSLSTDDAMRLVEVRDFLAGQSWFDLTQYRLNPPTGVVTHWSRLIDLPLAVLIKAGAAVLPVALAERIAVAIWPTALLLAYFAGIVRLARDLAGETAARIALIFAALMAPVLQHFRAGAIHHHNVQIVLVIWLLALFARTPVRPRDAAAAGFLWCVVGGHRSGNGAGGGRARHRYRVALGQRRANWSHARPSRMPALWQQARSSLASRR